MKRLIFILFACIPVLICAQGLRRSVCAVSPCYSSEESAALRQYALWLSRNGRPDDSRFILSTLQPDWHGSGVVVRREGRLCVLTQRYVTGYARTADVVFYLHDRTVSLKACAVLGTDGSTLCLVQLPDMAFFAALEVSDTAPDDGDDIAAAGYASLQGMPSWQLSRGFVSNAALEMDSTVYIQHSASLDYGSAGGPLLVRSGDTWHIAGINAWNNNRRTAVTLAVPATEVRHLLESAELFTDTLLSDPRLFQDMLPLNNTAPYKERAALQKETHRKIGVTGDIHKAEFGLFSDNYLSAADMCQGFNIEIALGRKRRMAVVGMQLGCLLHNTIPEHTTYMATYAPARPVPALLFGAYAGVQVPCRVAPQHLVLPRLTAGINGGPDFNFYDNGSTPQSVKLHTGTGMLTADLRAGAEYRYDFSSPMSYACAFYVGIHYNFHFFGTSARIDRPAANGKPYKHEFLPYIMHGIGIRTGVAF